MKQYALMEQWTLQTCCHTIGQQQMTPNIYSNYVQIIACLRVNSNERILYLSKMLTC